MSPSRLVVLAALLLASALSAQQLNQPPASSPPTRAQIARWVKQLGHDDFAVREQASAHLAEALDEAEPALRLAAQSADAEVTRRAKLLLEQFLPLTLQGHSDRVWSVAYSPDGKRIVSGSLDKTIRVWDADKGTDLFFLQGHTWSVRSVAYSPDGKRIVSASADGTMKVWRVPKPR